MLGEALDSALAARCAHRRAVPGDRGGQRRAAASPTTRCASGFPRSSGCTATRRWASARRSESGLERARHPWTYLMNNDVTLAPEALAQGARAARARRLRDRRRRSSSAARRAPRGDGLRRLVRERGRHCRCSTRSRSMTPCGRISRRAAARRCFAPRRCAATSRGTRALRPVLLRRPRMGRARMAGRLPRAVLPRSHAHHRHRATTARFYDARRRSRASSSATRAVRRCATCATPHPATLDAARLRAALREPARAGAPARRAAAFVQRWRTRRARMRCRRSAPPRLVPDCRVRT